MWLRDSLIFDEITAKLVFYYPVELEPHNRHAFNEGALLSELNAKAAIIGEELPLFIYKRGSQTSKRAARLGTSTI